MLNNEPNDYNSNEEDSIDIKLLLNKIAFHWRLFSLTIPLALVVAYFVNRYSDPVYRMNTTVLISVEEPSFNGLEGLMASYGMSSSKNAHYNELELMKSKGLTETVVEELGFELSYFAEGVIRLSEIYNDSPFYVEYDNSHKQLINVFFNITLDHSNSFKITNDITLADKTYNYSEKKYTPSVLQSNLDSSFKYGEWIESENYRFRVFKNSDNQLTHKSPTSSFKFIFNSYDELINNYNKAVSYNPIKESSVLELSIEGPHKGKLIDFLNTLTSNYISNGLSYKNSIADNTIDFIETQLALIGDTLETSERELEDFRSEIGIMDIGIESSQSSERFVALDDQSAKIRLELKYYKDLLVYLQDNEINSIISPSVAGIKDPILLSLVSNLQELNLTRSRLNYSMESQNPVITQVQIEIDQTIGALIANVKNLISTTELQDKDLNSRILVMEDMFSSLPASERQMLTIQREYGIHDKMFTFLLEKRVEAGITKAANQSDHKVINPARDFGDLPVSPNKSLRYAIALILAFIVPLSYILLKDFFKTTISSLEDIERLTKIPFLGTVSNNSYDFNIPVIKKPKSNIAESLRAIRTNLNFMVHNNKSCQIIAITSSVSGEGKTFIASNLSSMYAMSGKKTILIGCDLRKPKISTDDFGLKHDKGIVNYLVGQASLDQVIQKSKIQHLDVMLSGPVPPNPAELIDSEVFTSLISILSERYDRIIIDTAPLGMVADAQLIIPIVDNFIYVTRQGVTNKSMLKLINDKYVNNQVKNVSLVLNDFNVLESGSYGYG